MATKATAGQDRLHILIEIQASSLLTGATGGYGYGEDNKKEAATTPQAPRTPRFRNRLMRTTAESGMRAV